MVYWYVVAQCDWLGPNFGQAEYLDMNGYTEGTMDDQRIEDDGETGDPFLAYGISTPNSVPGTFTYGLAQMEIGLLGSYRIRINSSGVQIWDGDSWEDPLTAGGGGNLDDLDDVVITTPVDNEVLAYDNGSSTWINQTPAEAGLSAVGHTHGQLHNRSHTYDSGSDHSGTLSWSNVNKTGSNLTDLVTRNHNDLLNINAGDSYEHLTAGQVAALHAIYTNAEAVAAVAAADDYLKLVGDIMGGAINMNSNNITGVNTIITLATPNYDKFRLWTNPAYCIGLMDAMTYGGLNNYAMTFTVYHTVDRGWVWRDDDDAKNDGAMSLTTAGVLTVKGASTFQSSLQVDGNITTGGTVDGQDVAAMAADLANQCTTAEAHAYVEANALTLEQNLSFAGTQTVDGVDISIFNTAMREQSAVFPGAPSEGDFHYDEDDDSLYRYNAEAEAWIEVGARGASASINFPIGAIIMFKGVFTNNVTIAGWYKCDGNNGTVDLVDKFVRGGIASGAEGGSDDAVVVEHDHELFQSTGGTTTTLLTNTVGVAGKSRSLIEHEGISGTGKNIPAFYTLIYIERIS